MTIRTKPSTDAFREGFDRINWKDEGSVDSPLEAEVARLAADSPPSSDGWSVPDASRLKEGTMRKGGINRSYQITKRPPDPQPIRPRRCPRCSALAVLGDDGDWYCTESHDWIAAGTGE